MTKTFESPIKKSSTGFSFIEILLVIVIIGVILAVVLPRAWRANVEAKYGLLKQSATELGPWANEWATRQLESQPDTATAKLNDYIITLGGNGAAGTIAWVGESGNSNWNGNGGFIDVAGSGVGGSNGPPSVDVQGLVPPGKVIKNPFNGVPVFSSVNDPGGNIPVGALACTWQNDSAVSGTYRYYALIFLGTDSTSSSDFHAGQDTSLRGLRNGVFLAGLEP